MGRRSPRLPRSPSDPRSPRPGRLPEPGRLPIPGRPAGSWLGRLPAPPRSPSAPPAAAPPPMPRKLPTSLLPGRLAAPPPGRFEAMPPGPDGSWDGRFTPVPGRTPEGSCETPLPKDGRSTPVGSLFDGVRDGAEGSRPALGRDAPDDGSWDGRETFPVDGRLTFPADGRETFPADGRVAGRDAEPPPEGRE